MEPARSRSPKLKRADFSLDRPSNTDLVNSLFSQKKSKAKSTVDNSVEQPEIKLKSTESNVDHKAPENKLKSTESNVDHGATENAKIVYEQQRLDNSGNPNNSHDIIAMEKSSGLLKMFLPLSTVGDEDENSCMICTEDESQGEKRSSVEKERASLMEKERASLVSDVIPEEQSVPDVVIPDMEPIPESSQEKDAEAVASTEQAEEPSSTLSIPSPAPVLDSIIVDPTAKLSLAAAYHVSKSSSSVHSAALSNTLLVRTLAEQGKHLSSSAPIMSNYERFDDDDTNRKISSPQSLPSQCSSSESDVQVQVGGHVTFEVPGGGTAGFILDPAATTDRGNVFVSLRATIRRIVENIYFRLFTVVLILLDFILVIVDLSMSNCVSSNNSIESVSHVIISFFLLEVALRLLAKGMLFFIDVLDVIDMAVVVISFIVDMVFLALSPDDCNDKGVDRTVYARLVVVGRVVRIIRIVRIIYIAFTQRRHVSTATRQLISQNKRRYQKDGFDLDLCYITERVIAMSFPSKGLMAIYRNPVEEVARFFNTKHKDHYRIYNLCSERDYDESLFFNNVERIYIDDHNVPKAREMLRFADNVREWMEADPQNIIAIHCKGGKGRTGTMICIWLIESGLFEGAKHSLEYFGDRRTDLSKGKTFQGVETPSQSRYVEYFEKMLNEYNHQLPPKVVLNFKCFKIEGIKSVGNGDGSDLFMEIREDNVPFFECNLGTGVNCKVMKYTDSDSIIIELENCRPIHGDIKVMFKTNNKKIPIGYDKCPFYFWFNTSFIENHELVLTREELDNPHKPKTHHVFRENFTITVLFEPSKEDAV